MGTTHTEGLLSALGARYLKRLMSAPRGRAFMLDFMVYAEEADELGLFGALLASVDDPALGELVRRHRDDEQRHAAMLKECVARVGLPARPVPSELRIVERID